jgi:hypothetical protein
MSNTFTIAGYSTKNGVRKFRVANGSAVARAAVLRRDSHTEIKLFDLPSAMTREQAEQHLKSANTAAVTADAANTAPAKTPEEIEAIKAKNLETMRQVSARLEKTIEVA